MFRADPFSCPPHLASVNDGAEWTPLEVAARMRNAIGIAESPHPLTHPAYVKVLTEWRPAVAANRQVGGGLEPLSAVIDNARRHSSESSYSFVTGALLTWVKAKADRRGGRFIEFKLEGSGTRLPAVMWSRDLKRHGANVPSEGDLVVAIGRVEAKTITQVDVDEETGEEVVTTTHKFEATVNELKKLDDPLRAALTAAEQEHRSLRWWTGMSEAEKSEALAALIGFQPPPAPQPSRRIETDPILAPGAEVTKVPDDVYSVGAAVALAILRHAKTDTWADLVAKLNASEARQLMASLEVRDDQWAALAATPLELIAYSPRVSLGVCDACGNPTVIGKTAVKKCGYLPGCTGTLSGKVAPAQLIGDQPARSSKQTSQATQSDAAVLTLPLDGSSAATPTANVDARLPLPVIITAGKKTTLIPGLRFEVSGYRDPKNVMRVPDTFMRISLAEDYELPPGTEGVVIDSPDHYNAARKFGSGYNLADDPIVAAKVRTAYESMLAVPPAEPERDADVITGRFGDAS